MIFSFPFLPGDFFFFPPIYSPTLFFIIFPFHFLYTSHLLFAYRSLSRFCPFLFHSSLPDSPCLVFPFTILFSSYFYYLANIIFKILLFDFSHFLSSFHFTILLSFVPVLYFYLTLSFSLPYSFFPFTSFLEISSPFLFSTPFSSFLFFHQSSSCLSLHPLTLLSFSPLSYFFFKLYLSISFPFLHSCSFLSPPPLSVQPSLFIYGRLLHFVRSIITAVIITYGCNCVTVNMTEWLPSEERC